MKSISERQRYIKEELDRAGIVRVQDTATRLGVTGATIRRDLRIMESRHLLQRNYGCAYPVKEKATDPPLSEKYNLSKKEKDSIAKVASKLVQDNESLMVTSGSTIESFVRYIDPSGRYHVITPSILLARLFLEKGNAKVFILGGEVLNESLSVRDHTSINQLSHLRCNKLFFSCDGFDMDAGVTSAFIAESQLTIAMFDACQTHILLADSSKYGKIGLGKTCNLKDIDILITDDGLPKSARERIEMMGVRVIVA